MSILSLLEVNLVILFAKRVRYVKILRTTGLEGFRFRLGLKGFRSRDFEYCKELVK